MTFHAYSACGKVLICSMSYAFLHTIPPSPEELDGRPLKLGEPSRVSTTTLVAAPCVHTCQLSIFCASTSCIFHDPIISAIVHRLLAVGSSHGGLLLTGYYRGTL